MRQGNTPRHRTPGLEGDVGSPPHNGGYEGLTLQQNVTWSFAGKAVYAASQWLMLVILTKLTSPAEVGQFALGLAVTAPVVLFMNLRLREVYATDARSLFDFPDYLGLRLTTIPLALLTILLVVLTVGYRRETALIMGAIAVAKAWESISFMYYGLFQRFERMDVISRSLMIKGILSLVGLSAGIYLTGDVFWGVVGLSAAWAAVLIAYDIPRAASLARSIGPQVELKPRWNVQRLRGLAWFALPLGLTALLTSLNINLPLYFIELELGERELGIFAALAYFVTAGTTLIGALGDSSIARLAALHSAGKNAAFWSLLKRLLLVAGGIGLLGVLVTVLAGSALLELVYSADYAAEANVFTWVMVAGALSYLAWILGVAVVAMQKFRAKTIMLALVGSVLLVSSVLFISRWGLIGAAMAVLSGAVIHVAGGVLIVFRGFSGGDELPAPPAVHSAAVP